MAKKNTRAHINMPLAAAVTSGLLLALSYALNPIWVAAWVAPIPLLLAVMSSRWTTALALGALTGGIGSVSLLTYMIGLGGPLDAILISLLRAAQWALIAWVAHTAANRLPETVAVFVVPALFAGLEVLTAALSPHGSGGSIAYSQMDALPVIQVASLGGTAAIAFLLGLFANLMTYAIARGISAVRSLIAPGLILMLAFGFGMWRVTDVPEPSGPKVALISTNQFTGVPDEWRTVWATYVPAIEVAAVENSAELVLLPEKIFRIEDDELTEFLSEATALARLHDIDVVVGIDVRDEVAYNRAYFISAGGEVASYDKRHMIPGGESHFTPGRNDVVISTGGIDAALAICKDLDFPVTIKSLASGVTALLVPAWDFHDDAWFHSRLAILRGVENGIPVVRSARDGLLTISDAQGRVTVEVLSDNSMSVASANISAATSTPTLYSLIGESFGWGGLAFTGGAVLWGFVPRSSTNDRPRTELEPVSARKTATR